MRILTALLGLLLLITFVGCSSPAKTPALPPSPQDKLVTLLTENSGDLVRLDPDTVKVSGGNITLSLYFVKKELRDGVRREIWNATFTPSERLMALKARQLFDDSGKEMSAIVWDTYWEYVLPDTTTDDIMQAVVDYCKNRGLALDTAQASARSGFKYVAKSNANNAHYFYDPATIKADGSQARVDVLIVYENGPDGIRSALTTVRLDPKLQKYQIASQTPYDATGKPLAATSDPRWYPISPNSVFDMLTDTVVTFCKNNNITLK
ncbi:MAG: hypothetical protein P4N59_18280 [Negativicutes bacterium]|nr:hypothetical protein [Negativicutes bacterium]